MTKNNYLQNEDLDITELFAALWSNKFFILTFAVVGFFIGIYHLGNSKRLYVSQVVFKIEDTSENGISLPSEIGAIAALAGIGKAGSTQIDVLIERMQGKEFILLVDEAIDLKNDKLFNPKSLKAVQPGLISKIKSMFLDSPKIINLSIQTEQNIISSYRKFVDIDDTDAGAISISVSHTDPELASSYANSLMSIIKNLVNREQDTSTEARLSYLSETLADALQDMESSQQKLKNFTLKNNAAVKESFISGSLVLDQLRKELNEAKQFFDILNILESLLKSENLNNEEYQNLRLNYPLIDDVSFRRILGMSETISAWTWPDLFTVQAVSDTLSDRIQRLSVEIGNLEGEALQDASSAEILGTLAREARIAEATYKVLIEQVKSQSLAAGYKADNFKVFEKASPALKHSKPNTNVILLIAISSGIFFGSFIVIVRAVRSGIFYTTSALNSVVASGVSLQLKPIRRFTKLKLQKLLEKLAYHNPPVLDELILRTADKQLILIASAGSKTSAKSVGKVLAAKNSISDRKLLIYSDTGDVFSDYNNEAKSNDKQLAIINVNKKIDMLTNQPGSQKVQFFIAKNFKENMIKIKQDYDQIIFCSDNHKLHSTQCFETI